MGNLNDIKNPHNFQLKWDSARRIEKIPGSPLLVIGLAFCSNQYYAAAVNPVDRQNYVLHANVASQGASFKTTYADIKDDREHKAASDFFLKAGVFELYYKGTNWVFPRKPQAAKDPGTKTNEKLVPYKGKMYESYTHGQTNVYDPQGEDVIPPWFKGRYIR
jgi:hypothetical protein